ncbi:uracil permease, partial [Enterococcus faecium]
LGGIPGSGRKILIGKKINLDKKKNRLIASVILVVGIGGLVFEVGTFTLSAMALATVLGIILNLILPETSRSEEN